MNRRAGAGSRRRALRLRSVALTGTPGTGKSSVARALGNRFASVEIADLALALGAGRRRGRGVEVDLAAVARRLERDPGAAPTLLVGHLAHLLPLRDVVVLRCHPVELARRLARARRGSAADRRANVEAEATDVILLEAIGLGRRVWEVDTTARSVASVARTVRGTLLRRPRSRTGIVDWLGDEAVTDYLLRPVR